MAKEIRVFEVNGEELSTLKEVAKALGVKKVSLKDIEDGIYEGATTRVILDETPVDEALTNMEDVVDQETVDEDNSESTDLEDEDTDGEETNDDNDIEFPEVGSFKTKKDIQKFYKKLTTPQLEQWAELEGVLGNAKPTDHQPIWRMRVAMAILYLHFPKESTKKSKSKYAKYTTEQLVEMAAKAGVEVKDSKGDNRILRMYTIMALKEAGLLA